MPWIQVIPEDEAEGELHKVYTDLKEKRGKIANLVKVQSLNPAAMKSQMELYVTLMYGPLGLTREQRELLATVVSAANGCRYSVTHHAYALNHYWKDEAKLQKLIKDYRFISLPEKERRMIEYALKLTENPKKVRESDIEPLRKCGLTDPDILNISLIVSYFNMLNRIASGLGVEVSASEASGYKY